MGVRDGGGAWWLMVLLVSPPLCSYDIVGRFNGGANAGHTVVADGHKFAFHLLPCGLVYPHTVNIIGNGVVCDMEAMFEELAPLDEAGISTEGRLLVSDRAQLLFGFHKTIDGVLEERRAGGAIGTTRKGIGPAYASKAMREGIRVGHLKHYDSFKRKVRSLCESYQEMYHFDYDIDEELERCVVCFLCIANVAAADAWCMIQN